MVWQVRLSLSLRGPHPTSACMEPSPSQLAANDLQSSRWKPEYFGFLPFGKRHRWGSWLLLFV